MKPVIWDVAIVGAGPAGAAAALGALAAQPALNVVLLDRSSFPRDKSCGDGVAPHVLDVLETVGVRGLLDDWPSLDRLELRQGQAEVSGTMRRPAWVVPRSVLDARILRAAQEAGATFVQHRVRGLHCGEVVGVDDLLEARVVIGADGAHSLVRSAAGLAPVRRRALAIRGYAPPRPGRGGRQVIAFGAGKSPSYAWSFDRGDGLANVGYGELLDSARVPTRKHLLSQLELLLPEATVHASSWRGHQLPLHGWRLKQPEGPVLLAGDAAGLINPLTGEGIYYAVATGVLAGRSAAAALLAADPPSAGALHRSAVTDLLARHVRHTAAVAGLARFPRVIRAGLAAAHDQRFFDDIVELGLGPGLINATAFRGIVRELVPHSSTGAGRHSADGA